MDIQPDYTVEDRFFARLENALETATHTHICPSFPDSAFLRSGVGRCLHAVRSGREWVQALRDILRKPITVNNFFQALRSERRLALVKEINDELIGQCAIDPPADPFADQEELEGFALFAGDGHVHACSTHEEPIQEKRRSPAHLFMLDLRSRALSHLEITRVEDKDNPNRKSEHELRMLKRVPIKTLRMNQPTGTKVLIAYDRAVIDFEQWHKWKQGSGIYILTREKANMALGVIGENIVDRSDPRNLGVEADQLVGHSKGRCIRRVIYTDPLSGTTYRFITNEMTVPPGLIAAIYKSRWDIEKTFDELKNKLLEGKSWAKSSTSKCIHGTFLCLTHNLLVLLENTLEREEGIRDEKVLRRRAAREAKNTAQAKAENRPANPLLSLARRATQRSSQFLRWLRRVLLTKTPWRQAIVNLRPLMQHYLN